MWLDAKVRDTLSQCASAPRESLEIRPESLLKIGELCPTTRARTRRSPVLRQILSNPSGLRPIGSGLMSRGALVFSEIDDGRLKSISQPEDPE